ncbi:unnamed protein product [Arabis nemorensis]|uniref:Uncharacterized protein n=1 Tax=Arabis nemorensis TaxID=586526 RepID=A0A565BTL6_9BRAS|nr:unnamed protein product [Arabis nemorensis]
MRAPAYKDRILFQLETVNSADLKDPVVPAECSRFFDEGTWVADLKDSSTEGESDDGK